MKRKNSRNQVVRGLIPSVVALGLLALAETGYYVYGQIQAHRAQDESRLVSESYSQGTNNLETID